MISQADRFSPIGIFDSGPGGLAVLKEVQRLLPYEDVLYFGDTARQPYGPQPIVSVRKYAMEITAWLVNKGVKLVIIGCNTASVAGRRATQDLFPNLPVLGMIEPAVKAALRTSSGKRIGIWGTEITIDSKAYDSLILRSEPNAKVLGVGCPELLRLAEKGQLEDKQHLRTLAVKYFQPLVDFGIDTLVLGCTDLTCVREVIDEIVGPEVQIVDPAEEVVNEASLILKESNKLRSDAGSSPVYQFTITGDNLAEFAAFTARFINVPQVNVSRIRLEELSDSLAKFPVFEDTK